MYLTGLLSTGILALKYAIFWQRKYRPIFLLEKFVLILRGYGLAPSMRNARRIADNSGTVLLLAARNLLLVANRGSKRSCLTSILDSRNHSASIAKSPKIESQVSNKSSWSNLIVAYSFTPLLFFPSLKIDLTMSSVVPDSHLRG